MSDDTCASRAVIAVSPYAGGTSCYGANGWARGADSKMCFWKLEYCNENVTDACLHGPCCIIFILLGVVQVTSGIYYYLTIPVFKLIFNVIIGGTSVLIGIFGLVAVCICVSNVKKYEALLYCSTGVIFLNTINLILLEFGQLKEIFSDQFKARLKDTSYDLLPYEHGRLLTSITALIAVLVGFLESQLTFCCLNQVQYLVYERKLLVKPNNPETSADLEYVIDKRNIVNTSPSGSIASHRHHHGTGTLTKKPKGGTLPRKKEKVLAIAQTENTKIEVYTQSWVFKENGNGATPGSISSMSSPELSPKAGAKIRSHQRKVSEISQTPSERQAVQMVSFSRSVTPVPSPVPHDYEDRNSTFGTRSLHSRSNSDYLSVATTPKHYENTLSLTLRSPNRLSAAATTATSSFSHHLPQQQQDPEAFNKLRSTFANTAQADASYATLISELEQSLSGKLSHQQHQAAAPPPMTPTDGTAAMVTNSAMNASLSTDTLTGESSKSSKEGEFSKELELALQLIQELETPSECNPMNPKLFSLDGGGGPNSTNVDLTRTGSDKTLSALSLEDFTTTPTDTII